MWVRSLATPIGVCVHSAVCAINVNMERTHIAALVMSSQPPLSLKSPGRPQVPLGPIAGKSVVGWVADALLGSSIRRIAIVGDEPSSATRSELSARSDRALIEFVERQPDLAETVAIAIERLGSALSLQERSNILLVPAEAPHLVGSELRELVDEHLSSGGAATWLTSGHGESPSEADPIVGQTRSGSLAFTDVSAEPAGILCVNASMLVPALRRISTGHWGYRGFPQGSVVRVLEEAGHKVTVISRPQPVELITSSATRTSIEVQLRDRVVNGWLDRGTTIPDPRQVSIDAGVTLGQGVSVLPGSMLQGATVVGDGAIVGPNSQLIDAHIGAGAVVPHSVVQNAEVSINEQLQPFSVLGSAPS